MNIPISELFHDIRDRLLSEYGDLETANDETVSIIEQSINVTKKQIYLDNSININANDIARVNNIVERRLTGEPLQYIFGKAYFYNREFFVNPDVLIPRPDTETLADTVINTEEKRPATFVDIGTGSGILAAVLTAHCHDWTAIAIDISFKALQTALRNVRGNDEFTGKSTEPSVNQPVNKNVNLLCCDMLSAIKPEKRFDFIVSNPPYISSPQLETLDKSVTAYEPRLALCGGADGLDYYRVISTHAKTHIKDGGRLYLEIGFDQGATVPNILRDGGWKGIAVIKDLGGRNRVVTALR